MNEAKINTIRLWEKNVIMIIFVLLLFCYAFKHDTSPLA